MSHPLLKLFILATLFITNISKGFTQQPIRELDFLIGSWEVREDNAEKTWWEKTKRTASYTLDSTYIELVSSAVSSSGKQRTYRWFIHYNEKAAEYEMISMFGNWHKIQHDVLKWDPQKRTLTIRNGQDLGNNEEFHERLGHMTFNEGFTEYVWTGENKYGDPENPKSWKYTEVGIRSEIVKN